MQPTQQPYDPAKLQNADQAVPEFGDDSSLKNQVENTGGGDTKYTGEGVKTTALDYNEKVATQNLENKMLFGQAAEMENSKTAGYIEKRNDGIASALFNEGKTSREDVENYLNSQSGFQNSSEEARANTIESVYKRLGTKAPQDENSDTTPNNQPTEQAEKITPQDM